MLVIPENIKKDLQAKHYGIAGNHSAVQICEWTKKSLRNQGECYKNIFYGIETYNCAQVSPNVIWCDQNCIYCWRPTEYMLKKSVRGEVDDPRKIIEELVKARYKLLCGFKGYSKINKKKLQKTLEQFPSHWAISLSGEPTLYPKLSEFIKELKKRKVKTIFLVTNGQNPNMITLLKKKKALPTQLYVSLAAWDAKSYNKISRGIRKDAWKRLLRTLKLLPKLPCRTVVRLTVIRGINDSDSAIKNFAKLIEMAQADFLEVKAYMYIGYSRQRLKRENMPDHKNLKKFCAKLERYLKSYKYEDECVASRVVLYKNTGENRSKKVPDRWIIKPSKI